MNNYIGLALPDFMARFVFIVDGSLVYDSQTRQIIKLTEFKVATASCTTLGERGAAIKISGLWLTDPLRLTADVQLWRPGAARMFTEDDRNCLNTFRFPEHAAKGKGFAFFEAHIRYLFGKDYGLFLDWLAHIVQHPGVRPKIVPLHIAYRHGAGRGWVVEVMTGVLGWWNVTSHKMKDIAAGLWGDYLVERLLVAVPEVKDKGKIYEVDDQVRDIMTEPRLRVNLKGGRNIDMEIFARMFFMSNHPDAMALTGEDRRTWVTDLGVEIRDEAYFIRAYGMLGDDFYAGVFQGLAARDIANFNPGMRSPMTDAKRRLIGAIESDADEVIADMIAAGCRMVTTGQVRSWPSEEEVPDAHIRPALRTVSVKALGGKRIKWRGRAVSVFILDNTLKSQSEAFDEGRLRAELDLSAKLLVAGGTRELPPGDTVVEFTKPD